MDEIVACFWRWQSTGWCISAFAPRSYWQCALAVRVCFIETYCTLRNIVFLLSVLVGYLFGVIVQKMNLFSEDVKVQGAYINLMANCLDNFTHGLAIGGSFLIDAQSGWSTTACILIHEVRFFSTTLYYSILCFKDTPRVRWFRHFNAWLKVQRGTAPSNWNGSHRLVKVKFFHTLSLT